MPAPQRRSRAAGRRPARSGGDARRSRPPARGGRRRPPARGGGGGGGIGAGPIIASICILLLGVVGIIFILKEDKQPPKNDKPELASQPVGTPRKINAPVDPYEGRGPPPLLGKDMQHRAMSVAQKMQSMLGTIVRLQRESVEAKQAGDNDMWQEKLTEATGVHDEMKDLWNEVIAELPYNDKWNQEDVANHWLLSAVKPLEKAGKVLAGSDKIRRK